VRNITEEELKNKTADEKYLIILINGNSGLPISFVTL